MLSWRFKDCAWLFQIRKNSTMVFKRGKTQSCGDLRMTHIVERRFCEAILMRSLTYSTTKQTLINSINVCAGHPLHASHRWYELFAVC